MVVSELVTVVSGAGVDGGAGRIDGCCTGVGWQGWLLVGLESLVVVVLAVGQR